MCRSGCPTKDHESYAACLKSSGVAVAATINSPSQRMYDATKGDLKAYRDARSHGIQPESTTKEKVREAEAATRTLGRPYNAEKDPPARLISTKTAAKFVNWKE